MKSTDQCLQGGKKISINARNEWKRAKKGKKGKRCKMRDARCREMLLRIDTSGNGLDGLDGLDGQTGGASEQDPGSQLTKFKDQVPYNGTRD